MDKITVSTLAEKLVIKRHYLIVDTSNVLEVIHIINGQFKRYRNENLVVGKYALNTDCTERTWKVEFDATDEQWKAIMSNLHTNYELKLKPHNPKEVYVIKK